MAAVALAAGEPGELRWDEGAEADWRGEETALALLVWARRRRSIVAVVCVHLVCPLQRDPKGPRHVAVTPPCTRVRTQFTSILQWLSYISYSTSATTTTRLGFLHRCTRPHAVSRLGGHQHLRKRRRRDGTLQNSNATGARRAHAQQQPTSAQGGGRHMAYSAACPAYYTVDTPYPVYDSPRITSVSPGCLIEWYLAP